MVEEDAHHDRHISQIIKSPADDAILHALHMPVAKQPEHVGNGIAFLLGCVHAGNTDPMRPMGIIKYIKGIAIDDMNHLSSDTTRSRRGT